MKVYRQAQSTIIPRILKVPIATQGETIRAQARLTLLEGGILRRGLLQVLLILSLALTLLACAPSQRLTEQQRIEVFQFVWEEVRRSHYDPKLGGVDWDAVREAYLPKARTAEGDAAFYAVLNEMLGELKQSHFGVIPPGAFVAQEEARQRVGGHVVNSKQHCAWGNAHPCGGRAVADAHHHRLALH